MERALALAERGQGFVEPNPMVGCVIVQGDRIVGEGWHQRFGGPHAEIEALAQAADAAAGATMYVTLEPCCHFGKTPPCTNAILAAKIARVVIAQQDPFPQVDGGGIRQLEAAGIPVERGPLERASRELNAPYVKLVTAHRPWVLAKWAMSLDGKIATGSGDSRWISNETSRQRVHRLRGRVDAIIVGRGTAEADDPLLIAKPPGPRIAARVVLDSLASLAPDSQLVRTAREAPVWVVASDQSPDEHRRRLMEAGCVVVVSPGITSDERLAWLLDELGRRCMTNVLVEGGGRLLGALMDLRAIDEVHVFVAPKLIGGTQAKSPMAGRGAPSIAAALALDRPVIEQLDGDVYVRGRVGHWRRSPT